MGTQQSIEDKLVELDAKVVELREATREANAARKDLKQAKRDIENLVKNAFDALIAQHAERAEKLVGDHLADFTDKLMGHNNTFQAAIMHRWAYIEAMCATDPKVARLIALHVLKDAGGTVETDTAQWHLVREAPELDGSSTFAFPKSMGWRAQNDPMVEKAVQHAVKRHRPDLELLPVSTAKQKGINDE